MDYQSLDYLRQHRSSSIHSDQSYKCIFCSNYYETYKQMRNHMKMHKNYDSWMENFPISRLFACNVDVSIKIYLFTIIFYSINLILFFIVHHILKLLITPW